MVTAILDYDMVFDATSRQLSHPGNPDHALLRVLDWSDDAPASQVADH